MKYLDIHAHVFPETIAEKAVAYLEDYYHFHWEGNGLATDLLAGMDLAGVRRTVIFSSATKPEQVPAVNNYIAGLCCLQPERFTGFGTICFQYKLYRGTCIYCLFGIIDHYINICSRSQQFLSII